MLTWILLRYCGRGCGRTYWYCIPGVAVVAGAGAGAGADAGADVDTGDCIRSTLMLLPGGGISTAGI